MKLNFCAVFGNIKRIRRQDAEWKKIFAKDTFNKDCYPKHEKNSSDTTESQ